MKIAAQTSPSHRPVSRPRTQVGMYLIGLLLGFLMEHEAVPLAACVQGAYLVAACLDWCLHTLCFEHTLI